AEYTFLQDRLSFWLNYEDKPIKTQGSLLAAAKSLFQGAVNSGLVQPGHLPRSMLDVAGEVWLLDDALPRVREPQKPTVEAPPTLVPPKEVEGLGGIVNNSEVGIDWGGSIEGQGTLSNSIALHKTRTRSIFQTPRRLMSTILLPEKLQATRQY